MKWKDDDDEDDNQDDDDDDNDFRGNARNKPDGATMHPDCVSMSLGGFHVLCDI